MELQKYINFEKDLNNKIYAKDTILRKAHLLRSTSKATKKRYSGNYWNSFCIEDSKVSLETVVDSDEMLSRALIVWDAMLSALKKREIEAEKARQESLVQQMKDWSVKHEECERLDKFIIKLEKSLQESDISNDKHIQINEMVELGKAYSKITNPLSLDN